jgi:hypothetical protein
MWKYDVAFTRHGMLLLIYSWTFVSYGIYLLLDERLILIVGIYVLLLYAILHQTDFSKIVESDRESKVKLSRYHHAGPKGGDI